MDDKYVELSEEELLAFEGKDTVELSEEELADLESEEEVSDEQDFATVELAHQEGLRAENEILASQALFGEMLDPMKRPDSLEPGIPYELSTGGLKSLFYGHPGNANLEQPPFLAPDLVTFTAGQNQTLDGWGSKPRVERRTQAESKHFRSKLYLDARDIDMLTFIGEHTPVTPLALAVLTGQRIRDIVSRLYLLTVAGYVATDFSMDSPIYTLTALSVKMLELDSSVKPKAPSLQWFKHNYLVTMLAAEFTRGRLELSGAGDFRPPVSKAVQVPKHGTYWGTKQPYDFEQEKENGRRKGENVVSENTLRSSFVTLKKKLKASSATSVLDTARAELEQWDGQGIPPELRKGNEAALYVANPITGKEHAPDMVLKRLRGNNEKPQSVCVEIEQTLKQKQPGIDSSQEYYEILLTAILNQGVYGHVLYACMDKSVARVIKDAMEVVDKRANVGGEPGNRMHVIQLKPTLGQPVETLFVR